MLNRLPDAAAAALRGAWIAPDVALVAWNGAMWPGAFRPRLGRSALKPPFLSIRLADGDERIGLMRLGRAAEGKTLTLGDPPGGAPSLPLAALADDAAALADALPRPARARLLSLLLDAGLGLFRIAPDRRFLALAAALARDAAADAPAAVPVAEGPLGLRLLRAEGAPPPAGAVFVLGARRAVRIAAAGSGPSFLLVEAPAAGEVLCGGGETPWLRTIGAPAGELPALLDVFAAGGAVATSLAALLPDALTRRAAGDRDAAELLRVAALLAPARARTRPDVARPVTAALELALPDGEGGVFLRGWLRDPHGLVDGLSLASGRSMRALAEDEVHRFARRDLGERFRRAAHAPGDGGQGFVAHLPAAPRGVAQPDLVLRLSGGASVRLTPALRTLGAAAARDAVLASVRPEQTTPEMLDRCLGPAAARFHRAHLAGPRTPVVTRLGRMPARPEVSVLIPLYRNLSFLRTQVASFAADPAWAKVETIFVLDSPEQAAEVEHLLRGLHIMHGLPLVLAVLPRNLGYAAANNAGAALATAPLLLLLNSDVVPDAPGWLAPLAAAARKAGAAGPKLLFDDGSIQHAGLTFARDIDGLWYNRHDFKGMPRGHAPATVMRQVPGVTGAALMVRRALFEAVEGFTEDYVVGDYEDSDLCLKLRRAGAGIVYQPAAELWHFERRSISLHQGYTGTLASTYNRRLHAARWSDEMAALTKRYDSGKGGRR
jgi:GT2 family glycosyltransferase